MCWDPLYIGYTHTPSKAQSTKLIKETLISYSCQTVYIYAYMYTVVCKQSDKSFQSITIAT